MEKQNKLTNRHLIGIFFLLTFLISGMIYLYTAAPTVTFGDSGDFITAAYQLRYTHPPGYPVYVILAKLFSWIPLSGDIAYRINLLSVFFSALSVALTYLVSFKLLWQYYRKMERFENQDDRNSWTVLMHLSSLSGALIFGLSGTFWSQATVAKIHPLNAFFTISCLLLLINYLQKNRIQYWYSAVLLWGFSLGNHHTPVLYIIPVLVIFILTGKWKEIISGPVLLTTISFIILGFSIYLFLPLVTFRLPEVEWGRADTWTGFKQLLLREDYAPFRWTRSPERLFNQIQSAMMIFLTGQSTSYFALFMGMIFSGLGITGLITLIKKDKKYGIITLLTALCIWTFFILTNNHDMSRQQSLETRDVFFIPAYLIFGIWVGWGLFNIIQKNIQTIIQSPYLRIICFNLLLLLPFLGGLIQLGRHNEREYFLARDYAKCLLDTMEPNALFFVDDDMHQFPVWYLQQVKHYRKDVVVLSLSAFYKKYYFDSLREKQIPGFIIPPFDEKNIPKKDPQKGQIYLETKMMDFVTHNIRSRPCYFYFNNPLHIQSDYDIYQTGLIYKISTTKLISETPGENYPYVYLPLSYQYRLGTQFEEERDFWRNWSIFRISNYHRYNGNWFAKFGKYKEAEQEFRNAVMANSVNAQAYYDMGFMYQKQGAFRPAEECFEIAKKINPNLLNPEK